MIRNREEILDFVAIILVLGKQTRESDDEMFGQFVPVVVHSLLLLGGENLASGSAAHGSLTRGSLLHRATPWEGKETR